MLSIIGNHMAVSCKGENRTKINSACNFLDFAGAITLIALGALAFVGHGGATINALGANYGSWAMLGGGLATLLALHLNKPPGASQSLDRLESSSEEQVQSTWQ